MNKDTKNTEITNKIVARDVNDVILGRDPSEYSHEGNITFRCIIKECKKMYRSSCKHYEKKFIVEMVLRRIKNLDPPGRFVRQDPKNKNNYFVVSENEVNLKISRSLREKPYKSKAKTEIIDEKTRCKIIKVFRESFKAGSFQY